MREPGFPSPERGAETANSPTHNARHNRARGGSRRSHRIAACCVWSLYRARRLRGFYVLPRRAAKRGTPGLSYAGPVGAKQGPARSLLPGAYGPVNGYVGSTEPEALATVSMDRSIGPAVAARHSLALLRETRSLRESSECLIEERICPIFSASEGFKE